MRVPLLGPCYEDLGQKHAYVNELLQRLEGAAGVEAAGIASATYSMSVAVSGVAGGDPESPPAIAVRMVSPADLRAMGVSLVRGHWPSAANALDSVVVNETFARSLIPNGDPIGKTISGSFLSGTIVGVAHDFAYARLDGEAWPELYYPWQRSPATQSVTVTVRMSESAVPVVRRLVESVDHTQPIYQFQTLVQSLSESVAPRRFNMLLLEQYAERQSSWPSLARSVSSHAPFHAARVRLQCASPLALGPLLSCS